MKKIIFTFLLILIFWKAQSQTTYYWVGNNGSTATQWATASNWSTSPGGASGSGYPGSNGTASTDIAIIDGSNLGSVSSGTSVVLPVNTSPYIGQLFIKNGANVTLQNGSGSGSANTKTLIINGDGTSADDLTIDGTSSLTLTSVAANNKLAFQLGIASTNASTGTISGTLTINDANAAIVYLYVPNTASTLTFASNATCNIKCALASSYPFGSAGTSYSVTGSVIFSSGATLNMMSGYGSSSFLTITSGINPLVFQHGSTLVIQSAWNANNAKNCKVFSNLWIKNGGSITFDDNPYNIDNLTIDAGGSLTIKATGSVPVSGNIVNNGTLNAATSWSTAHLIMTGTSAQSISGTGTFGPFGAIAIATDANVTLGANISIGSTSATVTSSQIAGKLNTQTYTLSGTGTGIVTPDPINFKSAYATTITAANISSISGNVITLNPGVWSNYNLSEGLLVSGTNIPANTYIIATSSTNNNFTISNASTSTTVTDIGISNGNATLITANTNGIDGCIATTGTRTFSSGVNYVFNGATVTPLPASGVLTQANNITFNANVTLNNPLTVSGNVTVGSGSQLITGNNLTLSSTSSGTAAIAQGTGSYLSGNVTVQRYVGSSQHWRMVGFPFANGSTVAATTLSGFYTSNYRAYSFNETGDDGVNYGTSSTPNSGWQQFASGNLGQYQGLLLLGGTIASTINFSGPLNIGTQNINLSKTVNGWNLISNPFASNITWSTIQAASTNVGSAVYRYNPNTTAYAAYNASTSTSSDGTQGNVIENGGSFFVQATGASPILKIQESDKTTTAASATLFDVKLPAQGNTTVFGAASASQESMIRLTVKNDNDQYGDAVVVRWGGNYAATDLFDIKYDAYDLGRLNGVDIAVVDTAGVKYSIFHGSALQAAQFERRKIKLSLTQVVEGNYTLSSQLLSPFAGSNIIYLYDSYTNVYVKLDENNPSYQFTVNTDPSSKNVNRFSLVFNNITDEKNSHSSQAYLSNNPSAGNGFYISFNKNFNTVQWQLLDVSGKSIQIGALQNVQSQEVYHVGLQKNIQGLFFIKLIGDGNALNTVKLVKQ